jgi:hypothetical protein
MRFSDHKGPCPRCGYHGAHAAWCPEGVPVRKAKGAQATQPHKDRTKYDRKVSGRRVDCRDILLDKKGE